jgi:hypothetical protein
VGCGGAVAAHVTHFAQSVSGEGILHLMGLNIWVVNDNVRKGAILNSVKIFEIPIEKYFN